MPEFLLVRVSVWLACVAWFIGALCRLSPPRLKNDSTVSSHSLTKSEATFAWSWFVGAALLSIHIMASYAFVYHWNHHAALAATAEDSFRVTGVRASWGVYVNFAFAAIWLCYSLACLTGKRRRGWFDSAIYLFLACIVACATILFEVGAVRWTATIAAFILLALHVRAGKI